jgi:hypothetical protein
MKKIFLSMVVPLVCMATLSAQISQKEADNIVQQRLESETKPWTVYAKEDVQTGFEMITSTGESLELDYPAWVYYVSYAGETNGKYLIVKESNGNLLEINTKNDVGPDNLTEWKAVAFDIPFTEYSLEGTSCQWENLNYDETVIIINSAEELENYISCTEGSYPEIDFSQYTLLLVSGETPNGIEEITVKDLQQLSANEYELNIEILLNDATVLQKWTIALVVEKLSGESAVELNIIYEEIEYPIDVPFTEYLLGETLCLWANLSTYPYPSGTVVIIINNEEELEQYITCAEGNYPEVDFRSHTLLLAKGRSNNGQINDINKNLLKLSSQEYQLNIELFYGMTTTAECWIVALIMEKISDECNVTLNITEVPISCQLKNLNYPINSGALVIINSNEELENYYNCSEGSYPEIDFSEHSLILISGYSYTAPVEVVVKDFQILSTNEYQLDIEVLIGGWQTMQKWVYALIINKINEESVFDLNVIYTEVFY